MPRSTKKRKDLGGMRDWICVCNWKETPDDDVSLIRERPVIFQDWGQVDGFGFISRQQGGGFDFYQANSQNVPTHKITMRNPPDVLITARHWIYIPRSEHRREWYRVLLPARSIAGGCYIEVPVTLDEVYDDRADPAVLKTPEPECTEEPEIDPPVEIDCADGKPKKKRGRKKKASTKAPPPEPRVNRQTWGGYSV